MTRPQIHHESQSQRQHARVRLPATALVNGKAFLLRDLSASGLCIDNFPMALKKGQALPLTLQFDLEGFSFSLHLKTIVTHYDTAKKTLGAAFDNLSRDQIATLTAMIKSYVSGVLVSQSDLLAIAARDNFTKPRKEAEKTSTITKFRKICMAVLIGITAFAALFFLTSNLYEKLSLIKSYDASVRGENSIEALLPSRTAHRLSLQNRASVRVTGDEATHGGTVKELQTMPENPALTLVTVELENALPGDLNGRPAYIEFFLH